MPTGTTRIRLRPANTSRVNFWGQSALSGGWILYTLFAMQRDTQHDVLHWVHWLVLALGAAYLVFVLIDNAPVFGTQSYLEFTPGYIVHKSGLFRAKQVFAAEHIATLELRPLLLRVRQKDGRDLPLEPAPGEGPQPEADVPGAGAGVCRQARGNVGRNHRNVGLIKNLTDG